MARRRPLSAKVCVLGLEVIGGVVPLVEEVYLRTPSLRIVLDHGLRLIKLYVIKVLGLVGFFLSGRRALPEFELIVLNGDWRHVLALSIAIVLSPDLGLTVRVRLKVLGVPHEILCELAVACHCLQGSLLAMRSSTPLPHNHSCSSIQRCPHSFFILAYSATLEDHGCDSHPVLVWSFGVGSSIVASTLRRVHSLAIAHHPFILLVLLTSKDLSAAASSEDFDPLLKGLLVDLLLILL
mmetsp:Transcript_15718/g.15189  ORF Transcript_15718/g.15189 Transcript_15718/m.15189 type:complete len:238 (-) Transcript_15718:472-1185(-)